MSKFPTISTVLPPLVLQQDFWLNHGVSNWNPFSFSKRRAITQKQKIQIKCLNPLLSKFRIERYSMHGGQSKLSVCNWWGASAGARPNCQFSVDCTFTQSGYTTSSIATTSSTLRARLIFSTWPFLEQEHNTSWYWCTDQEIPHVIVEA